VGTEPGPADQPLRVEDEEVEFDIELYVYRYRDRPFTGERYERWPDGAVKAISEFVDGRLHGLNRAWFQDGRSWSEGRYKINQPVGLHRTWYRNGQLEEEKVYTEEGTWVSTSRWSEDGVLTYTDSPESGPSSLRRP
jgi:antitoxin component YwqK of YwqJK toxin-antitoxin module